MIANNFADGFDNWPVEPRWSQSVFGKCVHGWERFFSFYWILRLVRRVVHLGQYALEKMTQGVFQSRVCGLVAVLKCVGQRFFTCSHHKRITPTSKGALRLLLGHKSHDRAKLCRFEERPVNTGTRLVLFLIIWFVRVSETLAIAVIDRTRKGSWRVSWRKTLSLVRQLLGPNSSERQRKLLEYVYTRNKQIAILFVVKERSPRLSGLVTVASSQVLLCAVR